MTNIIPFPTRDERALAVGSNAFEQAEAVADYDRPAAIEQMMRLCGDINAAEVRLCAAAWLLDECGVRVVAGN